MRWLTDYHIYTSALKNYDGSKARAADSPILLVYRGGYGL